MLFLMFILILNIGISYLNARSAGKVWAESKALGGGIRLLTWCAAIQSAIGFSYVYVSILMVIVYKLHIISYSGILFMANLSYLFIIFPLVGSGVVITIQSWIQASREKSLGSMGVAAWNTFAQTYNMYYMVQNIGPAFNLVKDHFREIWDNDDDCDEDGVVVLLVIMALLGGVATTMLIMNVYTASLPVSTAVQQKYATSE